MSFSLVIIAVLPVGDNRSPAWTQCGPAAHPLFEMHPAFVAEVLSRSTEDVDRREKAQAYSASAGFQQCALLDPDHRRI